jgi:TRAP-type C4-dicarboxylate transport system permease small subunit
MINAASHPWVFFGRCVKVISERFALLAQLAILVLTLLMATDVIMRYFFNRPVPGGHELVQFLGAIFVSSGVAYCAVRKAHVDVDLITNMLPKRMQTVLSALTGFLAFCMWALVSWRTFIYAVESYHSPAMSAVLSIPQYPFVFVVGIGCALLTLVILVDTVEFAIKAVKP